MDQATRKQELNKIINSESSIISTGIKLRYQGENRLETVYKIPLSLLIYNKHNGRIAAEVKSYEAQNYPLNAESSEDSLKIEQFLWATKKDKNLKTMESLVIEGQNRHGIVTADGVIVDGNRRAFLLNKIFRERKVGKKEYSPQEVESCEYFNAIVLPEDASEKEIQKLETTYQMGEDDKLDYNPIQKYLKCKDLSNLGHDSEAIAEMMSEKKFQIDIWLSTLDLMDDYLKGLKYEDIYTRLEKKEDQFLSLDNALDVYKNRGVRAGGDWAYQDEDISDLKLICFDYIRADYEGKEFREIAKTSNRNSQGQGSIFSKQKLWDSFSQDHFDNIPEDEYTVVELRDEHPDEDLSVLLKARDEEWSKKVGDTLKSNLNRNISRLDDMRNAAQPLVLLEKALNTIKAVEYLQADFGQNSKVKDVVSEISKITWEMKKRIEKNEKHQQTCN